MAWSLLLDLSLSLGAARLTLQLSSGCPSLAITGPSGAGKSLCLRALAGLERASARGRVEVRGERWQDDAAGIFVPPWLRRVGWVPQDAVLFPHRTVRENLAWSGAASERELADVAALLRVGPLLDRRPRNLSGGERQRVALGRALLSRPTVLLLDEPFAALDRALAEELARSLAAHCEARALPLVLVSHDRDDVRLLAREVWSLESGALRRADPAD
jgi:molybdate transport system ATP-binding protein